MGVSVGTFRTENQGGKRLELPDKNRGELLVKN